MSETVNPSNAGRAGDTDPPGDVTRLLQRARTDRRAALDALIPLVYDTLRSLARHQLARERRDHTLETSALVHEAYGRLVGLTRIEWRDRGHFFIAAAGAMRRVLIDYALARTAKKRNGGIAAELDEAMLIADDRLEDVLALDQVLTRLEALHADAARVVECRVFAGMTVEETAEALELSPATVKRHWQLARAWLGKALVAGDPQA